MYLYVSTCTPNESLITYMNVKTLRHFPRFGALDTLNGWITSNKSFVDSFIVGQFQTRSITELVDKATLILY